MTHKLEPTAQDLGHFIPSHEVFTLQVDDEGGEESQTLQDEAPVFMEPEGEQIKLNASASFHTQTNFRTHKTSHRSQPVVLLRRKSCFQLCNLCLDSAKQLPRFSAFSWN